MSPYREVLSRVEAAKRGSGRAGDEVRVVAVSKGKGVDEILRVYEQGHRDFGESRAQDLDDKAGTLPGDIRWHFVGALQTNKTRLVRPIAALLHSMDRRSLALAWLKGTNRPPPVLVQVNVGDEPQKSGVTPDDAISIVDMALELGLEVLGLMAIPPIGETAEDSRVHFRRLRELRDEIAETHPSVVELSMGMTDDFAVAVEEGASIIRVGRAIFGPRE